MKKKANRTLRRMAAFLLALIMAAGLMSAGALAAQTSANDFVYTQSKDTVTTAGGTVTLTVSLPVGVPYDSIVFGADLTDAIDTYGCSGAIAAASGTEDWAFTPGFYKADPKQPACTMTTAELVTPSGSPMPMVNLTLKVPAGLKAGDVIRIYGTKIISVAHGSEDYFNKGNSDYKDGTREIFTVTVTASGAQTAAVTAPTLTGTLGAAITAATATQTGSATGGKFTAVGLPAGLALNEKTGVISGTPTTAGTGTYTVTYTPPDGGKAVTSAAAKYTFTEKSDPAPADPGTTPSAPDKPDMLRDDHVAYVVGYSDGTVKPGSNITRAEVAVIFFRLLNDETRTKNMTAVNNYSDVSKGSWYNTAVSTLSAMGIITGRNDGRFDGSATITRAEFAAIAARFDSSTYTGTNQFSDISGHWAASLINRAASKGWVTGYEGGAFRPNKAITRAEAMTLINRVLVRQPEKAADLVKGMRVWTDNSDTSAWYYLAVQEATNSHEYTAKADKTHETWTKLSTDPDWASYEK